MRQTLDAVFERGVFRPLEPPDVLDGQRVRLIVEAPSQPAPEDPLDLAAQVYRGLSADEIAEIERIALSRGSFFGDGPSAKRLRSEGTRRRPVRRA